MIRYLTYILPREDVSDENLAVDTALRRSNERSPFDGFSNYAQPEGMRTLRRQFISVDPFPESVWICITRHPYCNCGCSIVDGVCQRIKEYPFHKCKRQGRKTNEPGASHDIEGDRYTYQVHGPFTEKKEKNNLEPDVDLETWHFLPVEEPTTPDVDIAEFSGWTVDEFEAKLEKVRKRAYTKDATLQDDLVIPVWFSKTSLSNRKEWCKRSIHTRLRRCKGLNKKELTDEEKEIVEELGGEKMTPELIETVKHNHPKKEFIVRSGSYCCDLIAYANRIEIMLKEGYVWSIEPHW